MFCSILGPGCEEGSVSILIGGEYRRKAHGGVYHYQCTMPGSILVGSHTLVCDGNTWNDTAPTCLSKYRG